jgi:3-oxoadipate enol-lactonase
VPFVDTQDVRIHYQLEGPGDAPPLVFSNSLGTNLSMWDAQLPIVAKHFRVLRYDSRGHGQSSVPRAEYSVEQLARDAIALLDALKLQRVHFCGLSIGGMTGMWLGVNAPERLEKLVLCNTAPQLGTLQIWNARIKSVREGGTKGVAEAVVERWFTAGFREKNPGVAAQIRQMIESTSAEGYIASSAAVRDFNFWSEVQHIHAPTLVIAGAHDPAATPADGQKLAREIQGARYVELAAAHLSNIEAADRFTEEVSTFLNKP